MWGIEETTALLLREATMDTCGWYIVRLSKFDFAGLPPMGIRDFTDFSVGMCRRFDAASLGLKGC